MHASDELPGLPGPRRPASAGWSRWRRDLVRWRRPGARSGVARRVARTWLVVVLGFGAALFGCASPDAPAVSGTSPRPQVPALHPEIDGWDATVVTLHRAGAAPAEVHVRVAETAAQRSRGLMHVPGLPDGTGMLFLFPAEQRGGFWMRDTLIPLDIGFVAGDGSLTAVLTMVPCAEDPCPVYDPGVAYLAALEVPAGWFARAGVEPGAEVAWDDPAPAPVTQG